MPSKLFSDWLELVSSTATGSAAQSLFGHERAFTRLEKHVRNDWFLNVQQTSLKVAHARAKSQSGHSKLRDAGLRKRLRERQLVERSKYSYRPFIVSPCQVTRRSRVIHGGARCPSKARAGGAVDNPSPQWPSAPAFRVWSCFQ